jgi:hypothetical protein
LRIEHRIGERNLDFVWRLPIIIAETRRAHLPQAIPGVLPVVIRLWYNSISTAGATSVTLTNAEKQARYRERHLGVDGEKVCVGLNLNAATRAKMGRLACHRGYTITYLVEELIERAERRVRARLPSRALKAYYDADAVVMV